MSSAFTTLIAALKAALQAQPALAGVSITANRLRPISASQATAIVLRLDRAEAVEHVIGMLDWRSSIIVECYARAPGGGDPATAADALLGAVWQTIAAIDTSEIGADIALNPQIDWQYDDAETPIVCALIQLTAHHRTSTSTLQPGA